MASKAAGKQKSGSRPIRFLKSVLNELKKVTWPNKKELINYTIVVIVAVILMAILLWIFDSLFSLLLGLILG